MQYCLYLQNMGHCKCPLAERNWINYWYKHIIEHYISVRETEDDVYKLTRNNFKDIQFSEKKRRTKEYPQYAAFRVRKKGKWENTQVTFLTKKQTRKDKPEINEITVTYRKWLGMRLKRWVEDRKWYFSRIFLFV